jgi:AmmeMemoRadiSam system protein B
VGDAESDEVSAVIEDLYTEDTLIVVSSDLSHYHDYRSCQQRDRSTTAMIETMQADQIGPYDACGAYPIRGLLETARRHGWQVRTLDLRNSGDTSGDKSRVVGYGAYEFY